MTNSLREMNQRMQSWMNEKPSYVNDGTRLQGVQKGDIILFMFAANGDDGDSLIKAYRSHAFPIVTTNNRRNTIHRWCPVKSGVQDMPCQYCQQGHTEIKERMSIWMYVLNILHAQMPQPRQGQQVMPQWQQVPYLGSYYFNEEVQGFRIWETSAWKESPWIEINRLYEIYHGLHAFTAQIDVIGEMMSRRFKLTALPNTTGLPADLYERAKAECESIPQILTKELSSPVTWAPPAQSVPQPGMVMPQQQIWGVPNTATTPAAIPVVPFIAPGQTTAAPAPFQVPGVVQPTVQPVAPQTIISAPPTVPPSPVSVPVAPVEQPAAPTVGSVVPPIPTAFTIPQPVSQTEQPTQPVSEQPASPIAEQDNGARPLTKLF